MKTDTNNLLESIWVALMMIGFAITAHADPSCELKCTFEDNYEACMNECSENDDDRYDQSHLDQSCEYRCDDNYDDCSGFCHRLFEDNEDNYEACVDNCEDNRRTCESACQDNDDSGGGGGGSGGCFINSVTF